jgi:hypothetical protein
MRHSSYREPVPLGQRTHAEMMPSARTTSLVAVAAAVLLTVGGSTNAHAQAGIAPDRPDGDLAGGDLGDGDLAEVDAPAPDAGKPKAWETEEAERRSGFAMAITLGAGIGSAAGFPNEATKIGREAYYTETGIGAGSDMRLWLGGALTDWLNFGAGLDFNGFTADGTTSGSAVVILHADVFPLYTLGGAWRDAGVMLDFGTGSALTTPEDDPDTKLIDGGAVSHIGFGGFWEGVRFWRIAMGPFAEMKYTWSETVRRPMGILGWRTGLYVGP